MQVLEATAGTRKDSCIIKTIYPTSMIISSNRVYDIILEKQHEKEQINAFGLASNITSFEEYKKRFVGYILDQGQGYRIDIIDFTKKHDFFSIDEIGGLLIEYHPLTSREQEAIIVTLNDAVRRNNYFLQERKGIETIVDTIVIQYHDYMKNIRKMGINVGYDPMFR